VIARRSGGARLTLLPDLGGRPGLRGRAELPRRAELGRRPRLRGLAELARLAELRRRPGLRCTAKRTRLGELTRLDLLSWPWRRRTLPGSELWLALLAEITVDGQPVPRLADVALHRQPGTLSRVDLRRVAHVHVSADRAGGAERTRRRSRHGGACWLTWARLAHRSGLTGRADWALRGGDADGAALLLLGHLLRRAALAPAAYEQTCGDDQKQHAACANPTEHQQPLAAAWRDGERWYPGLTVTKVAGGRSLAGLGLTLRRLLGEPPGQFQRGGGINGAEPDLVAIAVVWPVRGRPGDRRPDLRRRHLPEPRLDQRGDPGS
jgi:hypothetical protein